MRSPSTANIRKLMGSPSLIFSILGKKHTGFQAKIYDNRGIACFSKVCIMPFHFCESPTLDPAFDNQKKSEEDFSFYEKK